MKLLDGSGFVLESDSELDGAGFMLECDICIVFMKLFHLDLAALLIKFLSTLEAER